MAKIDCDAASPTRAPRQLLEHNDTEVYRSDVFTKLVLTYWPPSHCEKGIPHDDFRLACRSDFALASSCRAVLVVFASGMLG